VVGYQCFEELCCPHQNDVNCGEFSTEKCAQLPVIFLNRFKSLQTCSEGKYNTEVVKHISVSLFHGEGGGGLLKWLTVIKQEIMGRTYFTPNY